MFSERNVSLHSVAASILWSCTFLLMLAGSIVALVASGTLALALGGVLIAHSLACSACAATVTIRNGLKHQNKLFQDAFTLGQDYGATPMRRRQ